MVKILLIILVAVIVALAAFAFYKLKTRLNKAHDAYIEVYSKYIELKNDTPKRDKNGRFTKRSDNE